MSKGFAATPGRWAARPNTATVILLAHALAGLLFLSPGYIRPDSVGVSSWLRSAVIDHDLLFFNEWAGFGLVVDGATMFKEVASSGALANHWWIGFSVMAAPFYLVAHGVSLATGQVADGFSGLYAVTLGWTVVLAAGVAGVATDRLIRRFVGEGWLVRSVTLTAIVIGTPVFWYTFRFPIGTHVVALLFVALFLERLTAESEDEWNVVLAGLWLGLAALTRLQHLVLLLPAVWWFFSTRDRWLRGSGVLAGVAGAVLVVQAAAWFAVYGTPLGPLVAGAAHGGATYIPFQKIRLIPVLFSWYHGLFTWSPLFLVALLGWGMALRDEGRVRVVAVLAFLAFGAEWAANGLVDRFFWGGYSFGSRRFLELAPLAGVGVAFVLVRLRPFLSAFLVLGSVVWSILLTIAALGGALELSRPVTFEMILGAVVAPGRLDIAGRPGLAIQLAGVALVAVTGALVRGALGTPKRASVVVACYLTVCLILLIALRGPTSAGVAEEAERAGVDVELSSHYGPLLDQRKLVEDEMRYLEQRGRMVEAAEARREVDVIDQKLRVVSQSGEVGEE